MNDILVDFSVEYNRKVEITTNALPLGECLGANVVKKKVKYNDWFENG